MSDYTTLKGLTDFNQTQLLESLGQNMVMFFDWGFTNAGAFNNIKLNNLDINGGSKAELKPVNDPNYSVGKVWQLPSKNLVWESGVYNNSSINISGVYLNSSFLPLNTSGNYAYNIDYRNGRVIFNSGLPLSSSLKMEYSCRLIDIKEARESKLMQYMQLDNYDLSTTQYINNSGEASILSQNKIQLPHIAIEVSPNIDSRPYEIGSFTEYRDIDILCHIFSKEYTYKNKIGDILINQKDKGFFLLDLDTIAKSGDFPLDYRGYKKSSVKNYSQLADTSNYREYQARFKNTYVSSNTYINYNFKDLIGNGVHHLVIRMTLEIIKTF